MLHVNRGEGTERNHLAGRGFDVNFVQRVGCLLELRFDFENDAILVELGENDRDLPLAERVVKRVVNRLGEDVEA